MQDISDELRKLINENGIDQAAIAQKCGVSQPTISRILRGRMSRTGPAYRKVRDALTSGTLKKDEYSSMSGAQERVIARIRKMSAPNEANALALDKLLEAIDKYASLNKETARDQRRYRAQK